MIELAKPLDAAAMAQVLGGWIKATPWMPKLHLPIEDVWFCSSLIDTCAVWVLRQPTINGFTVTDLTGNTATCSFTVTVTDSENPTIACPANIIVSNDPGQCGASVTYNVTSGDNCAGSTLTQSSGMASGSVFPVGPTSNSFKCGC